MRVLFVVHTSPKRKYTRHMTFASLQRSDVAEYTVAEQPLAASPQAYFVDLLAAATESNADVIVRLEDDIEVNRHLLHNIQTWAALQDPDFGVGFLSNASNYCPPFELTGSGCYRSLRQEVSAALGQVFLPRTLHRVLAAIACHPDHLHAMDAGLRNYRRAEGRADRVGGEFAPSRSRRATSPPCARCEGPAALFRLPDGQRVGWDLGDPATCRSCHGQTATKCSGHDGFAGSMAGPDDSPLTWRYTPRPRDLPRWVRNADDD